MGLLDGKAAIVTGSARGIGRATAELFVREGARVLINDIDGDVAEQAAGEIEGETAVFARDLTKDGVPDELVAKANEAFGSVDIVVNNAGVQHVAPVHEFPPERFSLIVRLMLEAPFRILRGALPHMYEQGWGRVINISSVHGLRASPFKSAYVAAKHGLEGLSKVVALEGAQRGVTSNCINPGYVRTPLVENQIAAQAAAHELPTDRIVEEVLLARSAVKRLIEPDEVASLAAYMCSPAAAYITGTSLVVDGGWTAS